MQSYLRDITLAKGLLGVHSKAIYVEANLNVKREISESFGPAEGLPSTKVGAFTQALYDEAKKEGWFVISMKNDWKRIFPFDP